MKTVTLIRHAKSSWRDRTIPDISRPLNKRGLSNAPEMGGRLKFAGVNFDHVYTSPALRATQTAVLATGVLGYHKEDIQHIPELYSFNYEDILYWLRELDVGQGNIAVVGHNPAITDLVNFLTLMSLENIPTCGIVRLFLKIASWDELGAASGEVDFYIYPKQIDLG